MLLLALSLGVVSHLTGALYIGNKTEPRNVCQTEDCEKSAKRIVEYMDSSISPCDDLYRFSCGTFLNLPGLRDDEKNISITQKAKEVENQMMNILQVPIDPTELRSYQIMKNFTILCLKQEVSDEREVAIRLSVVEKAGGWPVLGNWNSDGWSLLNTVIALREFGLEADSLFTIHVAADALNPSRAMLHIDQPRLLLSRYKSKMLKAAILLGADPETAESQLNEAMLFEEELAKKAATEEDRRNHQRLYNPHTVTQLKDRFGWLDWSLMLSSVWPSHTEDTTLIVQSVDYLRDLGRVLQNHSPIVIANYVMWHAVYSLTYFDNNMKLPYKRMPVHDEVSTKCLSLLESSPSLTITLNSAYVKKFLPENKKAYPDVHNMVDRIALEMARNIDELDWIDDQTKSEALHKVKNMKKMVGYPDELEDDNKIEELFKDFSMDQPSFTLAMMDLWQWERNQSFSFLWGETDLEDWKFQGLICTMVNAFYVPDKNAMAVPAGIIQWPFYSPDVPAAINYGSIGMIIGHEISHGFDDSGSQYDSEGKLRDWWKATTKELFNVKKKCYIKQYSQYKDQLTVINVNGTVTQGENIADNTGVKLAFRVYRDLVMESSTPHPVLPGLEEFTSDQLFFLAMGNIWCSRLGNETLTSMLKGYDPHSPPEFRVNGISSNLPVFARSFQCDKGDPMNRAGKCELW